MSSTDTLNYPARIESLSFYPIGDDEVERTAAVRVMSTNQFNKGEPAINGLYDSRMGTISDTYSCGTCEHGTKHCTGHNGYYKLNYPLVHITYKPYLQKWMCIICNRCDRIILDPTITYEGKLLYNLPKNSTKNIINYIHEEKVKKTSRPIYCDYCNNLQEFLKENSLKKFFPTLIQPKYVVVKKEYTNLLVLEEQTELKSDTSDYTVNKKMQATNKYSVLYFPEDIVRRLERLKDSALANIGIGIKAHPRNYIFYNLVIPPVNLRHINRNKSEQYNNFITGILEEIINKDMKLQPNVSYNNYIMFEKNIKIIEIIANTYNNYIKASDGDSSDSQPVNSIHGSIKGKKGVIRKQLLGKYPNGVFRCVISCNIDYEVSTIVIPKKFAKSIYYCETVTSYNVAKLQEYVNNMDNYPGCDKIKKFTLGKSIKNNGNYTLQLGDKVYRNIIDGDMIPICRFPSMKISNTCSVRVIVNNNKRANNSIGMNVIVCTLFDADFDGDTICGYYITDEATRYEYNLISNVNSNFMDGRTIVPMMGQVQDSVIAIGMLTMSKTRFTRWEAMNILNGIPVNIKFDKLEYTGREIFSMVLPKMNYTIKSPFFKESLIELYSDFDESDKIIRIVNGELISGIVCGSFITAKRKSLYHIIYNYYGVDVAMRTMRYHQIIANNFLFKHGITLTYRSFMMNDKTKKIINITQSQIYRKVDELNNKLIGGELIPPSGVNIRDYYNSEFRACLNTGDRYFAAILASLDPYNDWMMLMAMMGSKGNVGTLMKTFAPIGLVTVDGKMIPERLDKNRNSIYDHQFSMSLESKNYVPRSLVDGYRLRDLQPISISTRNDIITKGICTSEAGIENRNLSKNLESIIIDNKLFLSRNHGTQILEFNPGDDGMDYKNLFPSEYDLVFMDNSEIEKLYPRENNYLDNILADKAMYCKIEIAKQRSNAYYSIKNVIMTPLNMNQIINNIANPEDKGSDIKKLTAKINWVLDELHFSRFHANAKKKAYPPIIKTIFNNMIILIRASFTLEKLKYITTDTLDLIFAKTINQILSTFVTAGDAFGSAVNLTLTSPLTQYLIDAHHAGAAGGTSKDGLRDFKSLIGLLAPAKAHSNKTLIFLKEKYEESHENAVKLSNFIGTQVLDEYIIELRVLYEKFGENITFPEDGEIIKDIPNKSMFSADSLYNLKFRFLLDYKKMKAKFVSPEKIIMKINNIFGNDVKCIYGVSGSEIVMHMYFDISFNFKVKKTKSKELPIMESIELFIEFLRKKMIINEFDNLLNIKIKSMDKFAYDGTNVRKRKIYYLEATGINLESLYLINVVDKVRSTCNSIQEIYRLSGFMEARDRIIDILYSTFISLDLAVTNYIVVADLMMEAGFPTSLTPIGLNIREPDNVLLKASYKNPLAWLAIGALNCMNNSIISLSASLMVGQVPKVGTTYNDIILNPEYVSKLSSDTNMEDML